MSQVSLLTVIGAINTDLTARVARAPERGETVADGILTSQTGGKGANQAVAASRLGGTVRLIGAVGADEAGRSAIAALDEAGVDRRGVQVAAVATGTALIVLDEAGENSIVVCPGANAHISPFEIVLDPRTAVLAQLEVADDVLVRAGELTDGYFVLNVSPARQLPDPLRERVDLFIVNESEYAQLPELHQADRIAVTLGGRGAILLERGVEVARAEAVPTTVLNSVGAGDAFAAALTLGLLNGDDSAEALQRACAVGGAAVADPRSQPLLGSLETYRVTA